ncbi:MAG: hypothetical protein R3E39_04170 [Anaerolineae bacterium]
MASPKLTNLEDLVNEALRNPDPASRKHILRALQKYFHEDGIFELVHYVSQRDLDPEVRELAADLLDVVTIKLNRLALTKKTEVAPPNDSKLNSTSTSFLTKFWQRVRVG